MLEINVWENKKLSLLIYSLSYFFQLTSHCVWCTIVWRIWKLQDII